MSLGEVLAVAWIRARARRGDYILSLHGDLERRNDDLSIDDIEAARGRTRKKGPDMRKLEYGDCVYCGGDIAEVKDKLVYEHHGQVFIFEDVFLGKCGQCGERFLRPDTARKLEKLASTGRRRVTTVAVPVLKAG